jgi:NAD-dependent deacetylase
MSLRPENLAEAARWIRAARRLVVFTGAGVSAESGIPTFRDDAGFWQRFPPERFARWDGLLATAFIRPGQMAEFVHAVIAPIAAAKPSGIGIARMIALQPDRCGEVIVKAENGHRGSAPVPVVQKHRCRLDDRGSPGRGNHSRDPFNGREVTQV